MDNIIVGFAKFVFYISPNHPSRYRILAKSFAMQKRHDMALKYWTDARNRFPKHAGISKGRIRTLRALGRYDETIAEAERLIALEPSGPTGYIYRAKAFMQKEHYDKALEHWTDARSRFPDDDTIYRGQIHALRASGRHDAAMAEVQRLIAKNPTTPSGYIERFEILFAMSNYKEAYKSILETLKRNKPTFPVVNAFISAAAVIKGRKFGRRFCYHVLCTQPKPSEFLVRYLYLAAETGDVEAINSALSKFSRHRDKANRNLDLIMAIAHSNNLNMYQSLNLFLKHVSLKLAIFPISQIIIISALLGDRDNVQKGLSYLDEFHAINGADTNKSTHRDIKMHLRGNTTNDNIEKIMVDLKFLMKSENYDSAMNIASNYMKKYKMETGLSCVYLIAALKSGAYQFQPSDIVLENTVMFYWDNFDIPPQVNDLIEINKKNNTDMECHVYSDESAREFLQKYYDSYIVKAYENSNHPSQKGDIFRLAYLYERGGYYIDVDDVVFVKLAKHFKGVSAAFFMENIGHVGNNFLATKAGNRLFEDMLIEASESVTLGRFDGCIWRGTGPGLVTRHVAREVKRRLEDGSKADLRVSLPKEHKNISTYHLRLNYKNKGLHWMDENNAA